MHGTDRDSDDSSDDQENLKEAERILLKAQERFEKEKKKANKARRIKTVTTSGIFEDEDLERQLANLEREFVRKGNSGRTKLRRVRKGNLVNMSSSSSQRAVSEKYEQPSVMGGCNNYSSKKTRK